MRRVGGWDIPGISIPMRSWHVWIAGWDYSPTHHAIMKASTVFIDLTHTIIAFRKTEEERGQVKYPNTLTQRKDTYHKQFQLERRTEE